MDERLLRLAQDNPVVYRCLTHYRRGDVSYEQALTECVLVLAEINKEQFDMLVKHEQEKTAQHFIGYQGK